MTEIVSLSVCRNELGAIQALNYAIPHTRRCRLRRRILDYERSSGNRPKKFSSIRRRLVAVTVAEHHASWLAAVQCAAGLSEYAIHCPGRWIVQTDDPLLSPMRSGRFPLRFDLQAAAAICLSMNGFLSPLSTPFCLSILLMFSVLFVDGSPGRFPSLSDEVNSLSEEAFSPGSTTQIAGSRFAFRGAVCLTVPVHDTGICRRSAVASGKNQHA